MANDPRSPFHHAHPLAGKITAGMRTSQNRARRPHITMELAEMPRVTMEDRARQMFSLKDKKGTRVYYAENGVFNTADENGRPISFVGGLFKTADRMVIRFLQQFVEHGNIGYLELQEDAQDAAGQELSEKHPGSQGGRSSNGQSAQSTAGQESQHGEESAPKADPAIDAGADGSGTAVSDSQHNQELEEAPENQPQANVSLSPLERLRQRAGTS